MFIGVVSSIWCEQFVVMVVNSTNTLFRNIDIDIYIYIYIYILNVFQIIVSYTIYVNIINYPVNGNTVKQTVFRFVYLS